MSATSQKLIGTSGSGECSLITRVARRLRLDHRRPERRDFDLGTFMGTRNRGLSVSAPLLDRSLSKPFLDQRTLAHVQDGLISVLLEHVLLYNARNVVAGNLYHQLLRHFSIHEMGGITWQIWERFPSTVSYKLISGFKSIRCRI